MPQLQKCLFWLMKLWHARGGCVPLGSLSRAKSLAESGAPCQCAAHCFSQLHHQITLFSIQIEMFSLLLFPGYLMGVNFSPWWCFLTADSDPLFSCWSICVCVVRFIISHKKSSSSAAVKYYHSKGFNEGMRNQDYF